MNTLAEIEAAAEALPPEQKEELFRFLAAHLRPSNTPPRKARLVRKGNDALLEAPPGAPSMTPENVKRMLETGRELVARREFDFSIALDDACLASSSQGLG